MAEEDRNRDSGLPVGGMVIQVLLEVRRGDDWHPVRVSAFPGFRCALDSLPTFARQQKAEIDEVRARNLRTHEAYLSALRAVANEVSGSPGPSGSVDGFADG
jgi:hypothetical protein